MALGSAPLRVAVCVVALLSTSGIIPVRAQVPGGAWSEPYRLSSGAGRASEGYTVADDYGYVHVFWTETLFRDGRTVLQHARFDGVAWSSPNDIHVAGEMGSLSPSVDQNGQLYLAWTEGHTGSVHYTHAPANNALSAQNWVPPAQVDIPARNLQLRIDAGGVWHILYSQTEDPGVFYTRSADQGQTWSEPAWLDPDISPNHIPDSLNFEVDQTGGLHAVWFYGALTQEARPDLVRYARSVDGGRTWSAPLTMDRAVPERNYHLTNASPVMTVVGQTLHVVWAAGSLPYRYHRMSTDAGQTWSTARQVFGELHGQAFDGLAVDRAGRVHFLGQIRYPQGIYHVTWDQGLWTPPTLIYLIAQEGAEPGIGNRIHAHSTHPVVRAGNQLVLTFTDGPADPNRRLFVMYRLLDDLEPLEPNPTPAPIAQLVPAPSSTPWRPTPSPTPTPQGLALDSANQPFGQVGSSGISLTVPLIPTLLLLAAVFAVRLVVRARL